MTYGEHMLIVMLIMREVQMPLMQVINMPLMLDGHMPTFGTVHMDMFCMCVMCHHFSPFKGAQRAPENSLQPTCCECWVLVLPVLSS